MNHHDSLTYLFALNRAMYTLTRFPLAAISYVNPAAHIASALGEAFFADVTKPSWSIDAVKFADGAVEVVTNEVTLNRNFYELRRFSSGRNLPEILVIAPLSGHFATLLRRHVRLLLPHFNVTITDWKDPRHIPAEVGGFGVEDYIHEISVMFAHMKRTGGFHCIAVCQPGPLALLALARAEELDTARPRSLTLIAAPVDTRKNPTNVNKLAAEHSLEFFEKQLEFIPHHLDGRGRIVYPAHLQLAGFMLPNMEKHTSAHAQHFVDRFIGNHEAVKKHDEFYREFHSVMPLPQPYHLETLERVFKEHHLPTGRWLHHGNNISLSHIRRTRLLTIEGARDDICGVGQTSAAHKLTSNLPDYRKRALIIPHAGHYGAFQGKAFAEHGLPAIVALTK